MEEEWKPLPRRGTKKRRRVRPENGGEGAPCQDTQEGHVKATCLGESGQPPQKPLDTSQMQQVTAAVRRRAAEHRPERGEDMGNDGVAGEFYEYLDHTADVQLHAWGKDLTHAFENIVPCMLNYMTDLSKVDVDPSQTQTFEVEGHDLSSLLFAWLDEFLFRFSSEAFVCKEAKILEFVRPLENANTSSKSTGGAVGKLKEGERQGKYTIKVQAEGETFTLTKHPQGTEVKAITYSAMQIHENEGRADLYVIIDI